MAVVSLLLFGGLWSAVGSSNLGVVTCGSVVKLLNTRHNVRLHSHDVRYGSGTATRVRVGWEGLLGSGIGGAYRQSEGCGLRRLGEPVGWFLRLGGGESNWLVLKHLNGNLSYDELRVKHITSLLFRT